jgi:hypothetical protein
MKYFIRIGNNKQYVTATTFWPVFLGMLSLIIAIGAGWVMNIVDLLTKDYAAITVEVVVRVVGIFLVPLGAILGWFL